MKHTTPLVSVVVLNYNGENYLLNCLASVLKNDYSNYELILVDNASTDKSLKLAETYFGGNPRLRIIQNKENLGFSGGNNIGFQHSSGKYIVFLNNDTTVASDWLTQLVNAMENDSTIGIAQSLIYTIDGEKIQTAGWLFSNYLLKKYGLFEGKPDTSLYKQTFEVSFVCGASMIIRREILEVMGAFDDRIPFFYDDTLLSLKTILAGKKVVTVSNSKVFHISGATNVWKIRFTTYNLFKSNIVLLFDVYYKKMDLSKALMFNILHTAVMSFFNIQKKNVAAILGILEASVWGLMNYKFIWENRVIHWSKAVISPEELKNKFIKVNLPIAFYLFPTKLNRERFLTIIHSYEMSTIKR
ncbi:MAG: glycosyltransferase family 2 protein [Crenarchaeota archaeon]|nr:glycosyltransferase family 2 protein [Thermoproteota archaeon]